MRRYNKGPVTQRCIPLWTIRDSLSDLLGDPIFDPLTALKAVEICCEAGQRGLIELTSAYDDDLVPWDPEKPDDDLYSASLTHNTLAAIHDTLKEAGVGFHAITCNLHAHPIFKHGGLSNPSSHIQRLAELKMERAIRIGAALNAKRFTYWPAREGWNVGARTAFDKVYALIKHGLNHASGYIKKNDFSSYRGCTIEPKPDHSTGYSFIPTTGDAVAFINTLKDLDFWGVNPELTQQGADASTCAALLVKCQKLSYLNFGGQAKGHEDHGFPPLVGPEGLKRIITMFWVLQQVGWRGVVEYDCYMVRSEGEKQRQAEHLLQFIKNCSTGLAMTLIMANRLEAFDKRGYGALGESEADLAATAAMCGIHGHDVAKWLIAKTD